MSSVIMPGKQKTHIRLWKNIIQKGENLLVQAALVLKCFVTVGALVGASFHFFHSDAMNNLLVLHNKLHILSTQVTELGFISGTKEEFELVWLENNILRSRMS